MFSGEVASYDFRLDGMVRFIFISWACKVFYNLFLGYHKCKDFFLFMEIFYFLWGFISIPTHRNRAWFISREFSCEIGITVILGDDTPLMVRICMFHQEEFSGAFVICYTKYFPDLKQFMKSLFSDTLSLIFEWSMYDHIKDQTRYFDPFAT